MIKSFQDEIDQAHLAHFGVKGMQWGVRKAVRMVSQNYKSRTLSRFHDKVDRGKEKYDRKAATAVNPNKKKVYETRSANLAKASRGLAKARKLVNGMTTREALNKLQTKNGMTKSQQTVSRIMNMPNVNLIFAAADYAQKNG